MNNADELARQIFIALVPFAAKEYTKNSSGKEKDWYEGFAHTAFSAAEAFESIRMRLEGKREEAVVKNSNEKRGKEEIDKASKLKKMIKAEVKRSAK